MPGSFISLKKVVRESNLGRDSPADGMALLCERYVFLGGRRNGLVSEICAAMAVFWVIWMDREHRTFSREGRSWTVWMKSDRGLQFLMNSVSLVLALLQMLLCWFV